MPYAEKTSVPVGRSREQIEVMLNKVGVGKFAYVSEPAHTVLMFSYNNVPYRIQIELPSIEKFKGCSKANITKCRDREIRRLWRVAWLIVKNRVVLIEEGAEPFQAAFLSYMVVNKADTLYEKMQDALENGQIANAIPLIPFFGGSDK